MPGAPVRVEFRQGDYVEDPQFRESLNAVAGQAADGVSWQFGFGLQGAYSPGLGFTLALDPTLIPQVRRNSFVAKITGNSGAAHAWTEQATTGAGTWADKSGGRTGTTSARSGYQINGRRGYPSGWLVIMWEVIDTSNVTRYEFECEITFIPCTVEWTGGSDGDASTVAAWEYTFKDLAGNTLGEDALQVKPQSKGSRTYQAGSSGYGVAFYHGGWKLWDAGEVENTDTECD
jgi:hypothetical protein